MTHNGNLIMHICISYARISRHERRVCTVSVYILSELDMQWIFAFCLYMRAEMRADICCVPHTKVWRCVHVNGLKPHERQIHHFTRWFKSKYGIRIICHLMCSNESLSPNNMHQDIAFNWITLARPSLVLWCATAPPSFSSFCSRSREREMSWHSRQISSSLGENCMLMQRESRREREWMVNAK